MSIRRGSRNGRIACVEWFFISLHVKFIGDRVTGSEKNKKKKPVAVSRILKNGPVVKRGAAGVDVYAGRHSQIRHKHCNNCVIWIADTRVKFKLAALPNCFSQVLISIKCMNILLYNTYTIVFNFVNLPCTPSGEWRDVAAARAGVYLNVIHYCNVHI